MDTTCICGNFANKLCGRCLNKLYCCKECQIKDWFESHINYCHPANFIDKNIEKNKLTLYVNTIDINTNDKAILLSCDNGEYIIMDLYDEFIVWIDNINKLDLLPCCVEFGSDNGKYYARLL